VEIDTSAKVTANFTVNGAFAYTDATVAKFPNGPCYTGQTLAQGCYVDATNSSVQDLKGKPLNNVPKYKFNIGGEYDQPLPAVPFDSFVAFAYRWQDDVNFSLSQDPRTVQKAYGIADFSLGVNDKHDHYKVTLFVDNAFDKRYAESIGNTTSGFSGIAGALGSTWTVPRDGFRYYGARVDLSF
jgi:iron complex outermembrane receptor protein